MILILITQLNIYTFISIFAEFMIEQMKHPNIKIFILCFLCWYINSEIYSQEPVINEKKARRDSIRLDKIAKGKPMFTPFAGAGVAPELGFSVALGGVFSFKTNRHDSIIQRSSNTLSISYSTKNAFVFFNRVTSYWAEDKVRFNADMWLKNMPDNYWGVGYDAGRNTPKSDSTTSYNRLWWQINPQIFYRFSENFYAGLNIDLNQTVSSDENPKMKSDPDFIKYGNDNFNSGMGLAILYDSRDVPVNAWKGWHLLFTVTFYGDYLGSDNAYQVYDLDYRHYVNMFNRVGSTLALQIRYRSSRADVPWGELSQLGTPFDFRGYIWGRYRDNDMQYNIVEYRYQFKGRNPFNEHKLSRHGVVGWAGIGSIGKDITGFENWLPNYGFGYRFEVHPRMNLRLDIGFGNDSNGIYVNFNEAF